MSEEINNASVIVPRALIAGLFINGLLGFGMVLALMICLGNINAMLAAEETLTYPFIEVFGQATGSVTGASVMAALIVTMGVCGTVGALASASRMSWSFARDKGFPFHHILVKVSRSS